MSSLPLSSLSPLSFVFFVSVFVVVVFVVVVFVVVVFVVVVFVVVVFAVVVFALVSEEVDAGDQELDRCGDQRVNTICNV